MMLSCNSSAESSNNGEFKSNDDGVSVDLPTNPAPIELTQAQRVFASDNNQFTLNFLKKVNEADRSGKSFIYSPLSITYVLGMVNDAAEGKTRKELEQTLGFREGGIEAVNKYCKTLIENLPNVDKNAQLNIANAIFVNKQYALKTQFQQDMQQYYHAKAESLDFSSPSILSHINGWCNEKTKGMIPKILDETDPSIISYLLNAIYFKANWASKFDERDTQIEAFATANGDVQVPLMHKSLLINYVKNSTYAAVDIPYGNSMWSMCVMLPERGKTTDDIIAQLAKNGWTADYSNKNPLNGAQQYRVDLKLPRFETASDTEDCDGGLIGLLQPMGIQQIFNPSSSQVPNMCKQGNVFISMMRQKAAIKVNEKGSEAAAVTIGGVRLTSARPVEYPTAIFHANRPFVYVIRERSSGVILFVGKFTGK